MQHRFLWASALALTITAASLVESLGGVIMISTRKNVCPDWGTDSTDEKGPGMTSPGDVQMATLLGHHGYSCRLILDSLLNPTLGSDPDLYLKPTDENMKIDLVIWSGSSSSADIPEPPPGIPLMMGEHVTLGNNASRQGSIYLYAGTASSDPNESSTPPASRYMKVVAPNHPILQGILLDAAGRIKIFREPYPEEELRVPTGGKKNFEYRWCTQVVADAAPGTVILGVLDGAEERSCFAVAETGAALADGKVASARMVHLFTNENGSGGSRRVFLALTEWGRILFIRAAKWAMGEELQPYKSFQIQEIKAEGAGKVALSWEGSAKNLYRIQASDDLTNWQTVVDDITGADGLVSRTLDITAGPHTLFLRVGALP